MRRTDADFKAEIFRRFDDYKKKRKKKMMAAGSATLMLMLTVGVLHIPIGDFFAQPPAETTSLTAMGAQTTTESVTTTTAGACAESDGNLYENFTYGKADTDVLDGESSMEMLAQTLTPTGITVKRGLKTWRFDTAEDVTAIVDFMLRKDMSAALPAESASADHRKTYTFIFRYENGDEVKIEREYSDLEALFERLNTQK